MDKIYLDAAATTPAKKEVVEAVNEMLTVSFGNPSSLHSLGVEAEKKIKKAREKVADSIGASPGEIFFTSGGTESNNLAIFGLNSSLGHCITSKIEHPSVLEGFSMLEKKGCAVDYVSVDKKGYLNLEELYGIINKDTRLVSIGWINNEIGTVQNIKEIIDLIKKKSPRIMIHLDGVQAWGKIPLNVDELDVDAITLSAHKAGGPKGIGALYLRQKDSVEPLFGGGGQEKGLRSGTENTPGIVGMGASADMLPSREKVLKVARLKEDFFNELNRKIPEIYLIGPSLDCGAPHILNLSFPGLPAQVLVQSFSEKGVYVSAGSACSGNQEESHVLKALNLPPDIQKGAVRFSFLDSFNETEAYQAVQRITEVVNKLKAVIGGA